jgi:DNA-damage-inducible protein J
MASERKEAFMATTMVNVRMDEQTKKDMEAVCKELGMSMTTAFTIYAKKVGREHRIPFEVSVDPFYSEENIAHIRRGAKALDEGRGISHELADDGE